MMNRLNKPSFLEDAQVKLLFFGGKGGVGKTTCAAATALQLAQDAPQQLFLLVSTDPAHSLQDRLSPVVIPANLQVLELDAPALLFEFKQYYAKPLQQIATRGTFLEATDIQPLIDLSLPGLDELMAFLRLSDWINEEKYQTIIVDTAPTGHTLRLLEMPGLLKKWLRALDALLAKHRYMRRVLTGKTTYDELDQFLRHFADKIQQLENLLHHHQNCHFIPVLLAEPLSYQETRRLLNQLAEKQIAVHEVIFNQCATESQLRLRQQQIRQQFQKEFAHYHIWQKPVINDIASQLPIFWHDGQFNLQSIDSLDSPVLNQTIVVEQAARLPNAKIKLHFFVGKGGVGKTTLACATALHLANHWRNQKVLLFSTDPAHSLADCLDLRLDGGKINLIQGGLAAVEIQPDERFNQLKQQYAVEIKNFFASLSQNLDLPFEREAMLALLELSPSGIDEIMALTQLIDYLDYDMIIIDSAPTGHFIRLLELPELINQWLKVIFEILLKYKQILSLPTINLQLVQLSKNIKKLQQLLQQPTTTQISVVSMPTQLAFEETQDLVTVCQRWLPVSRLFLNRLTLETADNTLSRLEENHWKQHYQQIFPDLPQTIIYTGHPPGGIEALSLLGQQLYH